MRKAISRHWKNKRPSLPGGRATAAALSTSFHCEAVKLPGGLRVTQGMAEMRFLRTILPDDDPEGDGR